MAHGRTLDDAAPPASTSQAEFYNGFEASLAYWLAKSEDFGYDEISALRKQKLTTCAKIRGLLPSGERDTYGIPDQR